MRNDELGFLEIPGIQAFQEIIIQHSVFIIPFPLFPFFPFLERELQSQLHLTRIANALTQEAVKVEQSRSNRRIDVVRSVEGIEHFDHRDQRIFLAKPKWSLQAPVEGEVLIVFAFDIAGVATCGAAGRLRLCRMRLYTCA